MSKRVRPMTVASAALALATAMLLVSAAAAMAVPLPPRELRVDGNGETWQSKRSFRLVWTNPQPSGAALVAVHYRVRDPEGMTVIGPTRIPWEAWSINRLEVPRAPGAYTAEVWLEDANGAQGPSADTKLRFDDVQPGPVRPLASSWVGRTAFPLRIRLTHPSGEPPISGIRGYAVSVASDQERHPCAATDRCTDAETDLRGGVNDDVYVAPDLPEGAIQVQALAVSGSGMASATPGQMVFRVDKTSPTIRLHGLPPGWTNHPVGLTATATDAGSGMDPVAGAFPPFTAIAIDDHPPTTAVGASASATVIGEGTHRVAYYARDLAGNVDDGGSANAVRNPPPQTAVVRIDSTGPTVSFATAPNPRDPELLRVKVADGLSGAASGRGWIGVRRHGSGDPFVPLRAAPAPPGELRGRWESEDFPVGEYDFRAIGYDLAGNATATRLRANGGQMTLSNPVKATVELNAEFDGGEALRTVRYGGRGLLIGRLLTAARRPLDSLTVRIIERFPTAAGRPARVSMVRTDTRGGFRHRLPPGPSRDLFAAFDGTRTLARAASSSLRLAVRGEVRLRVSRRVARVGGKPLVFEGRVAGIPATIPSGGKTVQLQFRSSGLPWTEFRTVQTDGRGRFRYAYRFSDDDSRGVRFLFRAYAPAQRDWPYEPGGSRPLAVLGR